MPGIDIATTNTANPTTARPGAVDMIFTPTWEPVAIAISDIRTDAEPEPTETQPVETTSAVNTVLS